MTAAAAVARPTVGHELRTLPLQTLSYDDFQMHLPLTDLGFSVESKLMVMMMMMMMMILKSNINQHHRTIAALAAPQLIFPHNRSSVPFSLSPIAAAAGFASHP
jgi:hypothetical protein